MRSLMIVAAGVIVLFLMAGCSKKVSPSKTTSVTRLDKDVPAAKPVVKKVKIPTPQVIVVNDSVAKRTPEGRFYYDLNGKR